jgi:hypothetical protein
MFLDKENTDLIVKKSDNATRCAQGLDYKVYIWHGLY